MKTIILTGATQGFGLAIAHALDELDDVRLVLPVRDLPRGKDVAASLKHPARVVELDLSSLQAVRAFTASWNEPLYALVNNAGLQVMGPLARSAEGHELTFAVNWLAPLAMTLGLLRWLEGGRVVNVGSGTHNPQHPVAPRFGFSGGHFETIEALARGEVPAKSERLQGMDRYASSKLLVTAATPELARRYPKTTFLTIDPGLMPGTGLVRGAPKVLRVILAAVLKVLTPLLPDTSSTERSARAARWLLTSSEVRSGEIYDYQQQPALVWPKAREPELGRAIFEQSTALLGLPSPTP